MYQKPLRLVRACGWHSIDTGSRNRFREIALIAPDCLPLSGCLPRSDCSSVADGDGVLVEVHGRSSGPLGIYNKRELL